MRYATTDPSTGTVVREYPNLQDDGIQQAIGDSEDTFAKLRWSSVSERAAWLRHASTILLADLDRVAATLSLETGKTIRTARGEVEKSARACVWYAENAERVLEPEQVSGTAVGARSAQVLYEPIGIVLAVMPWNFPLWQILRFAVPALAGGNACLLKPAPNVPETSMYIAELFDRAGFPQGSLRSLFIDAEQVERVIADPRVRAVTLSGGVTAGRAVALAAAQQVKPVLLELGGSDPFVVMPSADLRASAMAAVQARCQNNGQSCVAAKRFVVHEEIAEEWEQIFVDEMKGLVVGHPLDERTDVGPLATEAGRKLIEELVDDAVDQGATVRCGGKRLAGPGWFYPPTVLANVTPAMRLYHEEAFGPVAQLHRVSDLAEAVALANCTDYGLGSSIWTHSSAEADEFIVQVEAGLVFVNGFTASHQELPFGGVKSSGYGRELSHFGLRNFCNVKSVWIGT